MTQEPETEFQLDFENFKTGNWLIDGQIKKLVKLVNEADLNRDGRRDIGQLISVLSQLLTILATINSVVDFNLLADILCRSPVVKDKPVFRDALQRLGKLVEETDALIPHDR